jgi:hypothetical protein
MPPDSSTSLGYAWTFRIEPRSFHDKVLKVKLDRLGYKVAPSRVENSAQVSSC